MADANPPTLDQLIELIRAELKLDADAVLTRDSKLIGGEHDLDSLDVLMLVTAIEKRFSVKIPSESIGQEAFENVGTLADFLLSRTAGGGASETPDHAEAS